MSVIETISEKLKAAPPEVAQQVLAFLQSLEAGTPSFQPAKSWKDVIDALPGQPVFHGDPVDIQRRVRAEWDSCRLGQALQRDPTCAAKI
jgi:hypothetical protein